MIGIKPARGRSGIRSLPGMGAAGLTLAIALMSGAEVPAYASPRHSVIPSRATLTSPAVTPQDHVGYSVAISGDTAVVGAPGMHGGAGAAQIWTQAGGSWHHQETIADPRGDANDAFAYSVTVTSSPAGTFAVIGGNDSNGKPDIVYVYQRSGTKWHLQSKIADPGKNSGDMFGDALAMSATTLVIGASCVNNLNGEFYIYKHTRTQWKLAAKFVNPAPYPDSFGASVSVSGTTVLIGAGNNAYVYQSDAGQGWHRAMTIANPGRKSAYFGWSVALSGKTAVIGAPGTKTTNKGTVYIYAQSHGKWSRQATLTDPPSPHAGLFGYSVAIVGQRALVGVPVHGNVNCGTVYEFTRSGTKWRLQQNEVSSSCAVGDRYGSAISLSGRTAIIGAPDKNEQAGAVYVVTVA